MSSDIPSPTDAGPEPTLTVAPADATFSAPAGSAAPGGRDAVDPHPEKIVGAAFAGGLVFALILKRLGR